MSEAAWTTEWMTTDLLIYIASFECSFMLFVVLCDLCVCHCIKMSKLINVKLGLTVLLCFI